MCNHTGILEVPDKRGGGFSTSRRMRSERLREPAPGIKTLVCGFKSAVSARSVCDLGHTCGSGLF